MAAQPPTLTEYLPRELYREIALHLDPRKDVATLLSLSLVSRAVQIEGQRVLFSLGPDSNVVPISEIADYRLSSHWKPWMDDPSAHAEKICGTYLKFLETIVAKPESLAGYVIKYDHFSTRFGGPDIDKVLMSALPLMRSLKSLSINLQYVYSDKRALSEITSFQLHTLSVTPPQRFSWIFTDFLHLQRALTHITILPAHNTMLDTVDSFNGIFPSLISVQTNNIVFWERLALNNDIKAVHLWGYKEVPEEGAAAIKKLKYLRFGSSAHPDSWVSYTDNFDNLSTKVLSLPSGADLDIEVLRMHMNGDIHKTVYNFTERIGKLRILIAWEGVLCHIAKDIPSLLFFRTVAAIAFARCSGLLYVIVPNYDTDKSAYLYQRSAQNATGTGPVMEEHQFNWDMEAQSGPDWWVEWEDILSGRSTLSLTHALVVDMSDLHSPDGLYSSSHFYTGLDSYW